jgi:hypothetical protein
MVPAWQLAETSMNFHHYVMEYIDKHVTCDASKQQESASLVTK